MAPVNVHVRGKGKVEHIAEIGIIRIYVSDEADNAIEATNQVVETTAKIQSEIQSLTEPPSTDSSARPAIKNWHSGTLSTSSYTPRTYNKEKDEYIYKDPRYTAEIYIVAAFQDMERLGEFTVGLAGMKLVGTRDVEWRLTQETMKQLRGEATGLAYQDALAQAKMYAVSMELEDIVPVDVAHVPENSYRRDDDCDVGFGLCDGGSDGASPTSVKLVQAPRRLSVKVTCNVTFYIE